MVLMEARIDGLDADGNVLKSDFEGEKKMTFTWGSSRSARQFGRRQCSCRAATAVELGKNGSKERPTRKENTIGDVIDVDSPCCAKRAKRDCPEQKPTRNPNPLPL